MEKSISFIFFSFPLTQWERAGCSVSDCNVIVLVGKLNLRYGHLFAPRIWISFPTDTIFSLPFSLLFFLPSYLASALLCDSSLLHSV